MKQYKCKRISEDIKIDGNLDKPIWEKAEKMTLVKNDDGGAPGHETTAMMLWNDNFLYVGFRCVDDEIIATMTGYNDPIYQEEVVEIFVDDDCDLQTYIEIEVSPINTLLHYNIHNNLKGKILTFARTAKVIESAVSHKKGSQGNEFIYDVEFAIPFSETILGSIEGPSVNTRWRANLYRIDRWAKGDVELSAWCPTNVPNFHRPDKFGEIIFVEKTAEIC